MMSHSTKSVGINTNAPSYFQKYLPYSETLESVTQLHEIEVINMTYEQSYLDLYEYCENIADNNIELLVDYLSCSEYNRLINLTQQYVLAGGHDLHLLTKMCNLIPRSTRDMLIRTAATLDKYAGKVTLDNLMLEVVTVKELGPCEQLLNAQLSLLAIEVAWSVVGGVLLPPSLVGTVLTSTYAFCTAVYYIGKYYECKTRELKST